MVVEMLVVCRVGGRSRSFREVVRLLCLFSGRFLPQVVRQGQQPGFNRYFFNAPKHKSFEVVIVFDIGKHRFGIEASLFSFLYTPFGLQPLFCCLFQPHIIQRDFYYPVARLCVADSI